MLIQCLLWICHLRQLIVFKRKCFISVLCSFDLVCKKNAISTLTNKILIVKETGSPLTKLANLHERTV